MNKNQLHKYKSQKDEEMLHNQAALKYITYSRAPRSSVTATLLKPLIQAM